MFTSLKKWFSKPSSCVNRRAPATRLRAFESLEQREVFAGFALPITADLGPLSNMVARTAALGDSSAGTKEVELYKFTLKAGSALSATTSQPANAAAVDTFLRLFDANGTPLAYDDDSAGNLYSKLTYSTTADGAYYLGVSGYGNSSYKPATGAALAAGKTGAFNLTVASAKSDSQFPSLTLTPAPAANTQTVPTIAGRVADVGSGVASLQGQLDGSALFAIPFATDGKFSYTPNLAVDGSADGAHRLLLQVTDHARNVTKSPSLTFNLDTKAPTLTLKSRDTSYYGTVDIKGTASDAGGIVRLETQIDGAAVKNQYVFADGSFSIFEPGYNFTEGVHRMTIRLTDRAGNVTQLPDIVWVRDITNPVLALDSQPADYVPASFTISGQVGDAGSGVSKVQAQLDNGAFLEVPVVNGRFSYAPNLKKDGSVDGYHSVNLKATDKAGNSASVSLIGFKWDSQAPTLAITSAATPAVIKSNVTITGELKDSNPYNSGTNYFTGKERLTGQLDGGPAFTIQTDNLGRFTYTTGFAVDGSADGAHRLTLQAVDRAGNVTKLPAINLVLSSKPDTQAPTIGANAVNSITRSIPTFTGRITDPGSGVQSAQVQLDGGAWSPLTLDGSGKYSWSPNLALTGAADGVHRVVVRASDKAGNVAQSPTLNFTLDTVSPQLKIDLPVPTKINGFAGPIYQLPVVATGAISLQGSVSDNATTPPSLQVQLDGRTPSTVQVVAGKFNLLLPITTDGIYSGTIQSIDLAGNSVSYRFQQTIRQLRITDSELWQPNGIHVHDSYLSNGQLLRQTFSNERLVQSEAWDAGSYALTTWDNAGNMRRTTTSLDTTEEYWTTAGGHKKTITRSDGSMVVSVFQDGKPIQDDVWRKPNDTNAPHQHTVWGEDGTKVSQWFEGGRKTQEDTWSSDNTHIRITWKRVSEYFGIRTNGTIVSTELNSGSDAGIGTIIREEFLEDGEDTLRIVSQRDEHGNYLTQITPPPLSKRGTSGDFYNHVLFMEVVRKTPADFHDLNSGDVIMQQWKDVGGRTEYSYYILDKGSQYSGGKDAGSYSVTTDGGGWQTTRHFINNLEVGVSSYDSERLGFTVRYDNNHQPITRSVRSRSASDVIETYDDYLSGESRYSVNGVTLYQFDPPSAATKGYSQRVTRDGKGNYDLEWIDDSTSRTVSTGLVITSSSASGPRYRESFHDGVLIKQDFTTGYRQVTERGVVLEEILPPSAKSHNHFARTVWDSSGNGSYQYTELEKPGGHIYFAVEYSAASHTWRETTYDMAGGWSRISYNDTATYHDGQVIRYPIYLREAYSDEAYTSTFYNYNALVQTTERYVANALVYKTVESFWQADHFLIEYSSYASRAHSAGDPNNAVRHVRYQENSRVWNYDEPCPMPAGLPVALSGYSGKDLERDWVHTRDHYVDVAKSVRDQASERGRAFFDVAKSQADSIAAFNPSKDLPQLRERLLQGAFADFGRPLAVTVPDGGSLMRGMPILSAPGKVAVSFDPSGFLGTHLSLPEWTTKLDAGTALGRLNAFRGAMSNTIDGAFKRAADALTTAMEAKNRTVNDPLANAGTIGGNEDGSGPTVVTATFRDGFVVIDGSRNDDAIVIREFNDIVSIDGIKIVTDSGLVDGIKASLIKTIIANGGRGNDVIDALGVDLPVRLDGGSGNDVLLGGNGSDKLIGGTGDDMLYGVAGDDQLTDWSGQNLLDGGDGNDTAELNPPLELALDWHRDADAFHVDGYDVTRFILQGVEFAKVIRDNIEATVSAKVSVSAPGNPVVIDLFTMKESSTNGESKGAYGAGKIKIGDFVSIKSDGSVSISAKIQTEVPGLTMDIGYSRKDGLNQVSLGPSYDLAGPIKAEIKVGVSAALQFSAKDPEFWDLSALQSWNSPRTQLADDDDRKSVLDQFGQRVSDGVKALGGDLAKVRDLANQAAKDAEIDFKKLNEALSRLPKPNVPNIDVKIRRVPNNQQPGPRSGGQGANSGNDSVLGDSGTVSNAPEDQVRGPSTQDNSSGVPSKGSHEFPDHQVYGKPPQ